MTARMCRRKLHIIPEGKSTCPECRKAGSKKYYDENREKCLSYMRERYRQKSKELNVKNREYYRQNRDRLSIYHRDYYKTHQDSTRRQVNVRARENREYGIWNSMRSRCCNSNDRGYMNYGARGIYVCDRWSGEDGYKNFLKDMGRRPEGRWSIERIDVNGPYCPENCRWATEKEQARNTRRNVFISYNGESKTIAQWAEEKGIKYGILWGRICALGWDIAKAMEMPPRVCMRG